MPELRLSDLRQSNPGLAESPTLEMLLSDLRRQGEPEPSSTATPSVSPWRPGSPATPSLSLDPIVDAVIGSVYNPENPSLVHRAANTLFGVENPPQERLDAAVPSRKGMVGDVSAKALQDAATILKLHEAGGGGSTFNPATRRPVTSGYAVAVFPNKEDALKLGRYTPSDVQPGPPTIERLSDFLADPKRQDILQKNKSLSVGTWESGGQTYYDIPATPSAEAVGANLGQKGGQLAMYDLKRGREIPVEPNPKPTQVRLSSIADMEDKIAQLQGEMRPYGKAKQMYEQGVDFKKSLGEAVGDPTWYRSAGYESIHDLFRSPEDWNMFLRFYAATSPQQQSAAGNLDAALKAFQLWKRGAPDAAYQKVFMEGHSGNILRAIHGGLEAEMTGPKVFEFNRAVPSLRASLAAGDPEAVAFDRHNGAFYFPRLGEEELSREHVQAGAARMREDARRVGVTPQEFAETVWRGFVTSQRGRGYGVNYAGAQPLDAQIRGRMAQRGIENISDYGKQPLDPKIVARLQKMGTQDIADWASKNGMSTPMALFLLGSAAGGIGAQAAPAGAAQ